MFLPKRMSALPANRVISRSALRQREETGAGSPNGGSSARYLGDVLDEAVSSGCTELVEATAVSSRRNGQGWQIAFDDGSSIDAEALVLAIGNQEPDPLAAFSNAGRRFISNPWGKDARAAVEDLASSGGAALLVGTGLTMVDLALSLDAAGHHGADRGPVAARPGTSSPCGQ